MRSCSGVESIREAERWRVAGERLRQLAPQLYAQIAADLTASLLVRAEEDRVIITESYHPA